MFSAEPLSIVFKGCSWKCPKKQLRDLFDKEGNCEAIEKIYLAPGINNSGGFFMLEFSIAREFFL
jgi:hypothetical protein